MRTLALLVTGSGAAVTTALLEAARDAGRAVPMARATTRTELDLGDPFAVRDIVTEWTRVVHGDGAHRAVVVNVDAYSDIEGAEHGQDEAFALNASGPAVLGAACAQAGAWLLHVSTAEVFGGPAAGPRQAEEEPTPVSAYARTRLAGEQAVREIHPDGSWVVRAGWIYGPSPTDVVGAAVAAAAGDAEVEAVVDHLGSPTWAGALGPALLALAFSDAPPGLLHAVPPDGASSHELVREVFRLRGADPARVHAVRAADLPGGGPERAAASILSPASWLSAGLPPLPAWRDSLREALGVGP